MAVKDLSETSFAVDAAVIEASCKAIVRHDVCQVVVSQSFDISCAVTWLTPNLFSTMVAMLQKEGTVVDGVVDIVACAVPVGEVRHVVRDIAATIGSEIIDYRIGVVGG